MTFGESLADKYGEKGPDPLGGDRGLLFLSIQSSIEEQFEFLQARWINNRARPRGPGGHDMIVGQNARPRMACGDVISSVPQLQSGEVTARRQFVVPTGGGYFFVPSLNALRTVIAPDSGVRASGQHDAMASPAWQRRLQFALPKPQIGNRVFTTVKRTRLAGAAGAAILTNAG